MNKVKKSTFFSYLNGMISVLLAAIILTTVTSCGTIFYNSSNDEVAVFDVEATDGKTDTPKYDILAYVKEKDRVYWYMKSNNGAIPQDAFQCLKPYGFTDEEIQSSIKQVQDLYNNRAGE